MQIFLKIATLNGAKFVKTLPLWVQNALSGPTLKGAKSQKTDPVWGSIRGDQMYGSAPPPGDVIKAVMLTRCYAVTPHLEMLPVPF